MKWASKTKIYQIFLKKGIRTATFAGRIRVAALLDKDAEKWIGKIITVGGWAKTNRNQGKDAFFELTDGSSMKGIQIVVSKTVKNFEAVGKEGIGSCLQIKGLVVKSQGKGQLIEILVTNDDEHEVKIMGSCDPNEYKLIKGKDSKMNIETLRDICHLRPRTNVIGCVTRIRNNLAYATHQFFQTRGFLYVHTPIITGADCEGAGEMFQVTTLFPKEKEKLDTKTLLDNDGCVDYKKDFFHKPTYLTVSGQLAVENYACALSDVYTFGPTFRAEVSNTTKHLAEFWMIEPEMCFADIYDDMECAENYLKFCLKYVLENNMEDLEFLDKNVETGLIDRLKNTTENSFIRISYTEAIEILKKAVENDKKLFKEKEKKSDKTDKKKQKEKEESKIETKCEDVETKCENTDTKESKIEKVQNENLKKKDKRNITWGIDLASEHERYLTEVVFKMPTIVYNYPKEIKSFYMRQNEDGKTVAAMDVLVPKIGEIIGGSQREERYDKLIERIKELGMNEKSYWWYLELRKFGTVPHCGFGLGFERMVMMATGIENIRDVIPYPRDPGHAEY